MSSFNNAFNVDSDQLVDPESPVANLTRRVKKRAFNKMAGSVLNVETGVEESASPSASILGDVFLSQSLAAKKRSFCEMDQGHLHDTKNESFAMDPPRCLIHNPTEACWAVADHVVDGLLRLVPLILSRKEGGFDNVCGKVLSYFDKEHFQFWIPDNGHMRHPQKFELSYCICYCKPASLLS